MRAACMRSSIVAILLLHLFAMTATAQLFSGPSSFTTAPWTQASGPLVNNLTLTDLPNGFSVAGQVFVTVQPGASAGILLAWEVQRPLDPTFTPAQWLVNNAALIGFINAPVGNGSASGSFFTDYTLTAGSTAALNFSHSGPGITNYNTIATQPFFYSAGGANFMRQSYFVDFNYNGPGGTYILDFPADSYTLPIPEPASLVPLALGALLLRRRRR